MQPSGLAQRTRRCAERENHANQDPFNPLTFRLNRETCLVATTPGVNTNTPLREVSLQIRQGAGQFRARIDADPSHRHQLTLALRIFPFRHLLKHRSRSVVILGVSVVRDHGGLGDLLLDSQSAGGSLGLRVAAAIMDFYATQRPSRDLLDQADLLG